MPEVVAAERRAAARDRETVAASRRAVACPGGRCRAPYSCEGRVPLHSEPQPAGSPRSGSEWPCAAGAGDGAGTGCAMDEIPGRTPPPRTRRTTHGPPNDSYPVQNSRKAAGAPPASESGGEAAVLESSMPQETNAIVNTSLDPTLSPCQRQLNLSAHLWRAHVNVSALLCTTIAGCDALLG